MKVIHTHLRSERILEITDDDGHTGRFDLAPYFRPDTFAELHDDAAFRRIHNDRYFIYRKGMRRRLVGRYYRNPLAVVAAPY